MTKAKEIKAAIKELGDNMAGGFLLKPKSKKTSYYSFAEEGGVLFMTLHLNEAGEHWHRDRQRAQRLLRNLERFYGLKSEVYEDGSFGISLKQKIKTQTNAA